MNTATKDTLLVLAAVIMILTPMLKPWITVSVGVAALIGVISYHVYDYTRKH